MLGVSYDKVAVKRARKDLLQKVRNDWETVFHQALDQSYAPNPKNLTQPPSDAIEWRERTYASSDPSSAETSESEDAPSTRRLPKRPAPKPRTSSFVNHHCMHPDGSDCDGDSSPTADPPRNREGDQARKKQERKRRRIKRLEEEMKWNQGLMNWERTRDIWCRARRDDGAEGVSSSSSLETTATSTSSAAAGSLDGKDDLQTTAGTDTPAGASSRPQAPPPPRISTTLLPLTPPIIPPTDPVRRHVASQYSAIYSKVVVESVAPQVPINLAHMVPALVQGWKDNDEWPPKPIPDPTQATRRHPGFDPGFFKQAAVIPQVNSSVRRTRKADGKNNLMVETGKRLLGHGHGKKTTSEDRKGTPSPTSRTSESNGEKESRSPSNVRRHVSRLSQALKGKSPTVASD